MRFPGTGEEYGILVPGDRTDWPFGSRPFKEGTNGGPEVLLQRRHPAQGAWGRFSVDHLVTGHHMPLTGQASQERHGDSSGTGGPISILPWEWSWV